MLSNINQEGETEEHLYEMMEDTYEEINFRQQGNQGNAAYGLNETYVAMGALSGQEEDANMCYHQNENERPPIYQNIDQNSKKRRSVYGEPFYATGRPAEGPWNPSFQKGISTYPPDTNTVLEEFLENYEEYLSHIDNTPLEEKENIERVQFLLHTVFPYLESTLTKTGMTPHILNILVRLSCCKKCSLVTGHALYTILDILSKTTYDSGEVFNNFVMKCESDLRHSILGQAQGETAVIDHEVAEDQGLRVTVYTRVLMILYTNVMQELIPRAALDKKETYADLVKKLTGLQEQKVFEKKEWPRYAVSCIKEIQARLTTPQKRKNNARQNFLTWLQDYNRSGEENKIKRNEGIETFLSKIKASRNTWLDFHTVLFYLGSQITKRPRNMDILRTLVEKYLQYHTDLSRKWSSEGEWQTGLVLSSVLEGIIQHNHDKATRSQACLCLVFYFKSLDKRNSLEKLLARESLQRCLYVPTENIRRLILSHLEQTKEDGQENLPMTHSMDYLLQRYKKELPKNSLRFIGILHKKGYFSANFRGGNATIKILESSKDSILREQRAAPTRIHWQLVNEAYTLRRLNSKPHPNILKVFAYDTSAQPYHLITEQVAKGSLLQYLQDSRSHLNHMPSPSELTKMMLGIMDAVIYLIEQHLVHLAVTAANVLVSQDNVCKLTGFQYTREMAEKPCNGRYEYVNVHDEMATRHSAPECFKWGRFSEKSVSWAIGVLIFEMYTYGVSPYNQFSNQQGEQIRNYIVAGGKLKMEDCIRKEVRDLMDKCLQYDREKRPDLRELKIEMERIYQQFTREDNDCPAASYPSLTNVDLAQTKDAMNTSNALEDRDKEKYIGYFGSPTRSHDIPMIRISNGVQQIKELVEKTKQSDLKKLKNLKHKNMVTVHSIDHHDERYLALVTEDSGRGNVLRIVLNKQVRLDTLVTFIAQIAQAMEYMHDNDVIHGDLRAEHIMVFHNQVKVSRLGRSKSIGKMVDIRCKMPEDAVRWSPPEVIKDEIYSYSSDVYSFGLMCFELFTAFSAAEGSTADDVKPFPSIKNEQVLAYLEGNNRPARPESMPLWLYVILKQCLLHRPAERPPFVLIVDALTSSKPFESCLLSHWIERHRNEADNNDINKTQPERASHVIPKENHKSCEELHKLVAVEVFRKHTYSYEPGNKEPVLPDEEEIYDVIHDTASGRIPQSLFEKLTNNTSGYITYEQIHCPNPGKPQRSKQPLPPIHHPVQETGNPTATQANSTLALSATVSASKASTDVRSEQILEEDEGAVGGQPAQDSWFSVSTNENFGATECSWHSMTPVYGHQHDYCRTNPHNRLVPLPRHKLRKHES